MRTLDCPLAARSLAGWLIGDWGAGIARCGFRLQVGHQQGDVRRGNAADSACLGQTRRTNPRELFKSLGPQLSNVGVAEVGGDALFSESSLTRLLEAAYRRLGLVNFFTVGEDEVRAWTCRRGDLAPQAAGKIHTDMERGFIRMEVMRCGDILELGSEAAVVKVGKQRLEGRTYAVEEGDVVVVRFSKG